MDVDGGAEEGSEEVGVEAPIAQRLPRRPRRGHIRTCESSSSEDDDDDSDSEDSDWE